MIQQEKSHPPPIFDDSTIVNNIADCDVSDVVLNMEFGPNGSIILPFSPNTKSLIHSDIVSLDGDQQLNSQKRSTRYLSRSSTDIQNSQPCSSWDHDHLVYLARSRQTSSDQSLDALEPTENFHEQSRAKVLISQESSQTGADVHTDPKPCCSKTLDPPTFRASSRLSTNGL